MLVRARNWRAEDEHERLHAPRLGESTSASRADRGDAANRGRTREKRRRLESSSASITERKRASARMTRATSFNRSQTLSAKQGPD